MWDPCLPNGLFTACKWGVILTTYLDLQLFDCLEKSSPNIFSPICTVMVMNPMVESKKSPETNNTWKAKCPIFKAIVAGFRRKVA